MAPLPYELLDAQEWTLDVHDSRENTSGRDEDDDTVDEWADGKSTISQGSEIIQAATRNGQPVSSSQNQSGTDRSDGPEWTTVTTKTRNKPSQPQKFHISENKTSLPPRPKTGSNPARPAPKASPTKAAHPSPKVKSAQALRKPINGRQAKPAHVFNFARDNAAKAAFRNRRPHDGEHKLHKAVYEIEPNRTKLYNLLEGFGIRFKTFLRPPQLPTDRQILIWGQQQDIDRTIRHIKEWERSLEAGPVPTNSKARGTFASVKSAATHDYDKGIQRLDREAAFKIYQQIPEPGKHFPFQGWVMWETNEDSPDCTDCPDPHEVFGVSLEAFDPIRRQNKCHIMFDEESGALRVLAQKKEHMDAAVQRIRVAIEGLKAQSASNIAKYFIDLKAPSSAVREDVALISQQSKMEVTMGPVIPFSHGNSIKDEAKTKWIEQCNEIEKRTQLQIEQTIKSAIPALRYQSGLIQFRVLFGTFGITKFPLEEGTRSLPLKSFVERMGTRGVTGGLTRELQVRQSWDTIMEYFRTSTLFETDDLAGEAEYIQGRFVINRVDKPAVRYVRNVTRTISGTYDLEGGRWSRDDGKDSQTPLRIYMAQLDQQTSWVLQISKHQQLDKAYVDPQMAHFEESLIFDCKDIKSVHRTGRNQFSFRPDAQTLKPSIFEQKTTCHYRLANAPQWSVEISRFDKYRPGSELPITTDWSASMFNHDWDALLSTNDRLKIGEHAEWEAKLETFLPLSDSQDSSSATPAVDELLQTIRTVTSFFDDLRRL